MNKIVPLIFILFSISIYSKGQVDYRSIDSVIFDNYIKVFEKKQNLPLGKLLLETALYFKGKPYVASTLEGNKDEILVVNLNQFDCNTFVESCMALAKTVKFGDKTFDKFSKELRHIRYRDGIINGYDSRLHYVSDWAFDNAKNGIVINKTNFLGGKLDEKKIYFMSTHSTSYPMLINNSAMITKLSLIENKINNRKATYVLPKEKIKMAENKIEDGDVVAFATSINGLDYSHIGIAYWHKNELRFVHASTRTMSVIIEPKSLYDYCLQSKRCTGISVFKLNN